MSYFGVMPEQFLSRGSVNKTGLWSCGQVCVGLGFLCVVGWFCLSFVFVWGFLCLVGFFYFFLSYSLH